MNIRDKVLLVEDERTIRSFMQAILTANGYDVLMAGTGAMADTMIASHCPDIIILDLGLPDMDGMTILRNVRKWSKVPILVVSARSHERDKVEALVEEVACADMPTKFGHFKIHGFINKVSGEHHVALTMGDIANGEPVLCRVHSECLTGDTFGSKRCDCGEQLHEAMSMIEREGKRAIVYLNQEGRGIGLCNKIKAYQLQDEGLDTAEANLRLGFRVDERDYGVGASIIRELGIKHMRLMTNNPLKRAGLEGYGLHIDEIVPIVIAPNKYNEHYLETKEVRMGHTLGLFKKK